MLCRVPGKEEFYETLRYFDVMLKNGMWGASEHRVSAQDLIGKGYDEVILATGVSPGCPKSKGSIIPRSWATWMRCWSGSRLANELPSWGREVSGFDVSEFLTHEGQSPSLNISKFMSEWGLISAWTHAAEFAVSSPIWKRLRAKYSCCSVKPLRSARIWARQPAGFTAPRSKSNVQMIPGVNTSRSMTRVFMSASASKLKCWR